MVALASQVLVIWLSLCYGLVEPLLQRVRCVQFDGYSLLINIMWTIYIALPTKLRLLVRHCKSKTRLYLAISSEGTQVLDRQLMEQLELICPNMEFILYYGASELNYITYCTGKEW